MSQVLTKKQQAMRESMRASSKKQRIAGLLYFFGVLLMTVAAFFPLIRNVSFSITGDLNILNCWGPMEEMAYFKLSVFAIGMNFFVSLLYVFTVAVCLLNVILSVLTLDGLFRKGSKEIGYNQNALAMDRLAKIFSSTYVAQLYLVYFTHMFIESTPTTLFYLVTLLFLAVHFVGGYIGMGTSRFNVEDGMIKEEPRVKGRFLPMVRNVMQMVLVAALMFFMSQANIINNYLFFFNKESWVTMFGDFKANFGTIVSHCFNPLLQLSICHFMLLIVVHAANPTEWDREGSKAKGMWTVRIFAILTMAAALAFNGLKMYLALAHGSTAVSMQMIYVLVIAAALCVMEFLLASLPKDRENVPCADPVAELPDEVACAECDSCGGAATTVAEVDEDGRVYATPIATNALKREAYKAALKAKWLERAKEDASPETMQEEVKNWKKPADEDEELVLGEAKKVKCPHCGEIVWAKEGAVAYVCPECAERFSF